MKRWMCFCSMLLFVSALSGCHKAEVPESTKPLCRYVTQVDVYWQDSGQSMHRVYSREESMESVLLYLRLLKDQGTALQVPETVPGGTYTIALSLSDGSEHCYRQRGEEYFSGPDGQWYLLNPWQGRRLPMLLRLMPTDEMAPAYNDVEPTASID